MSQLSWPLWHVTRTAQPQHCTGRGTCEGLGDQLRFAEPAFILDLLGVAALLAVVVLTVVWLIAGALRLDAQERASAHRA